MIADAADGVSRLDNIGFGGLMVGLLIGGVVIAGVLVPVALLAWRFITGGAK